MKFVHVVITFFLIASSIYPASAQDKQHFDWTSRWEIPDMENASSNFYIILNEVSSEINGQHCFVASYAIECAQEDDKTLTNSEDIDFKTIELDFISQYSMGSFSETTGRERLTVINPDRIKWEALEMPSSKRPPTPIPAEKELVRVN